MTISGKHPVTVTESRNCSCNTNKGFPKTIKLDEGLKLETSVLESFFTVANVLY